MAELLSPSVWNGSPKVAPLANVDTPPVVAGPPLLGSGRDRKCVLERKPNEERLASVAGLGGTPVDAAPGPGRLPDLFISTASPTRSDRPVRRGGPPLKSGPRLRLSPIELP